MAEPTPRVHLDADIRAKFGLELVELDLPTLEERLKQAHFHHRALEIQSNAPHRDAFLSFRLRLARYGMDPLILSVIAGFLVTLAAGLVANSLVEVSSLTLMSATIIVVLLIGAGSGYVTWRALRYPQDAYTCPESYFETELTRVKAKRVAARESLKKSKSIVENLAKNVRDLRAALEEQNIRSMQLQDRRILLAIDWDKLTGLEFETLLEQIYTLNGYSVELTPNSGDHGGDLIVEKNGKRTCIQAKRWNAPVGNDAVQQAYSGQGFYECHDCAVVTTSRFTPKAIELALRLKCQLIDKQELRRMVQGEHFTIDENKASESPRNRSEVFTISQSCQSDATEMRSDLQIESQAVGDLMGKKGQKRQEEYPFNFCLDSLEEAKSKIRKRAEKQWPDDYEMQLHVVSEESKAYRKLANFEDLDGIPIHVLGGIREHIAVEWPDEYSMQLHELEKELEAYLELQGLSVSDIPIEVFQSIVRNARQEWNDEYRMQLVEIKQQVRAYKKLRRL